MLAVASGASAQTVPSTIEDVRKDARMHVGPLYLTPTLQLKEAGIDSNVYNDKGEPEADFTFTLTPAAHLWIPIGSRALISTNFAPDMIWYAKNVTQRSVNPAGIFRADVQLTRVSLFGSYSLAELHQRPNQEIDVRARRIEDAASAGIAYHVTPKVSVELAGTRSVSEYDDKAEFLGTRLAETLNRTNGGGSLILRHRITPLTSWSLRVEKFGDRFPLSPERDSDSLRIMPAVEFQPRALIKGQAAFGFRRFVPKDETILPRYAGFVANLGLSYTLKGSTSFSVTYLRDLNYSFEPKQPYFVNNTVGATIRRALGGRFDLLGSAERYQYRYRKLLIPNVTPTDEEPRNDITWKYSSSLGYKVGRDGRVGFGFSYWHRDSIVANDRNYDRLQVGLTMNYGF